MAGSEGQPGGGSGIISGINVTPLVDVMLVLLVIFMVTAKIVVTPAVPLDLPRAAHSEAVQVVLSVIVPAHGPTLVDGIALPPTGASDDGAGGEGMLAERARAALARDPDLRAVIQAEADVPHGRVLRLLDELRAAGLTRVAFGALPVGGRKP